MFGKKALKGGREEGLDHPSYTVLVLGCQKNHDVFFLFLQKCVVTFPKTQYFLDLTACNRKRTQTLKWYRSGIKFKICY